VQHHSPLPVAPQLEGDIRCIKGGDLTIRQRRTRGSLAYEHRHSVVTFSVSTAVRVGRTPSRIECVTRPRPSPLSSHDASATCMIDGSIMLCCRTLRVKQRMREPAYAPVPRSKAAGRSGLVSDASFSPCCDRRGGLSIPRLPDVPSLTAAARSRFVSLTIGGRGQLPALTADSRQADLGHIQVAHRLLSSAKRARSTRIAAGYQSSECRVSPQLGRRCYWPMETWWLKDARRKLGLCFATAALGGLGRWVETHSRHAPATSPRT
jgi:hypothetical protein